MQNNTLLFPPPAITASTDSGLFIMAAIDGGKACDEIS